MRRLRVGLAQINPTVGDLSGNVAKIKAYIDRARELEVDLVAFPELAITGYPPEDLVLKPSFVEENLEALREVAGYCRGLTAVIGFVDSDSDTRNAAAVVYDGRVVDVYHKIYLPNYGVFDEDRYFRPGEVCPVYRINGVNVGVNICEDIWYPVGPMTAQAQAGAEVIVNINGSPYHVGKGRHRERMLATRAADETIIICYVNMVGGQDELVFDGASAVFGPAGELVARAPQFEEHLLVVDLDVGAVFRRRLHDPRRRKESLLFPAPGDRVRWVEVTGTPPAPKSRRIEARIADLLDYPAEVYQALVLGVRDYVRKTGFEKVVVGLSGGIDSSLTAVIAVDALGPENVIGVSMPSRYTSEASILDAERLARNLGIRFLTIPIEPAFRAFLDEVFAEAFAGTGFGVAEENIQSRIRGIILMGLSNKFGWLVLTTGNKSELATGYATLYGDMAGGFAVLKDVFKTMVYDLARYRNRLAGFDLIPESVLKKEPSAELRPGQRDVDTLPPYEILDPILKAYVEEDRSFQDIVELGFDPALVARVIRMVDNNEYKRRQAPPGVKITPRAFGKDRRLPIVNHFREGAKLLG